MIKKAIKKVTAVALCVLMLTGIFSVTALAAQPTPSDMIDIFELNAEFYSQYKGAIEAIYRGMMQHKSVIDISAYRVSEEYEEVLYDAVKRTHPELFFIAHRYYHNTNFDNTIAQYKPVYLYTEYQTNQMLPEFYNKADWYLDMVSDDMDDFTKAIVLHDALNLNCVYLEKDSNGNNCNNYTFMIEGWGVCENYSEVYAYLLAQLGIKSEIVTSSAMGHQWMKINLDGSDYYYNVDITWDDPLLSTEEGRDNPCKVYHDLFLISDEEISQGDDYFRHYDYSSIHDSDNTFDNHSSLHNLTNPMFYVNGKLYTINVSQNNGYLSTYNHSDDTFTSVFMIEDKWHTGGTYWSGNFSGIAEYKGLLYYNGENCVYTYNPATGVKRTIRDNVFNDGSQLYGLYVSDGKLYGLKAWTPKDIDFTEEYICDCLEPHTITVDSNILDGTVNVNLQSAFAGDIVTLNAAPDAGYGLDGFAVTDASGNEVTVNKGSFEMPDADVSVAASFNENIVYFKPSENWKTADARFAAYVFNTSGYSWVSLAETPDSDVYKAVLPSGAWYNIIFCRMNPYTTDNNWDNKWNQTNDLTLTGNLKKCYQVPSGYWDNSGDEGWVSYTPPGYTVNYYYELDGTTNVITKTGLQTDETDPVTIARLNDPSGRIKSPYYTYSIDNAEKSGNTIDVRLTAAERNYTVTVDGKKYGTYKFLQQAKVTSDVPTGFEIDGKLAKFGREITFYVTGNIDITTNKDAVHEDSALLNHTGTYYNASTLSLEFLATANIEGFERMGVAFGSSYKTQAQIASAVNSFTTLGSTKVVNKIAVHNSKVDCANSSGQYQFRYAPSVNVSSIPENASLYLYTFAVTDNAVVVSEVVSLPVSTLIA